MFLCFYVFMFFCFLCFYVILLDTANNSISIRPALTAVLFIFFIYFSLSLGNLAANMLRAKKTFLFFSFCKNKYVVCKNFSFDSSRTFRYVYGCVRVCHFYFLVYTKRVYAGDTYTYCAHTHPPPPPPHYIPPPLTPPPTHTAYLHVKKHARVFRRGGIR